MRSEQDGAPRGGRERSQRQLRVGELIRHALADALTRGAVRDPGLDGRSLTVTEVRVSPDLRNATAFVLPLGGVGTEEALAALRRAAPYLRHLVGQTMTTKFVPTLSFRADTAFDEGERLERLLRSERVRRDLDQADDAEAADRNARPDDGGDGT